MHGVIWNTCISISCIVICVSVSTFTCILLDRKRKRKTVQEKEKGFPNINSHLYEVKSKFARTVRHVQIINSQSLMHYCTTLKGQYIGLNSNKVVLVYSFCVLVPVFNFHIYNSHKKLNHKHWIMSKPTILLKMSDSKMDNKDVGILINIFLCMYLRCSIDGY